MSKITENFNDIIRFALGLPEIRNGEFGKRTSALIERHLVRKGPLPADWKLVGFVLDSETTILVSLDYVNGKPGVHGAVGVTYRLYVGNRELIYKVMKDFEGSAENWIVKEDYPPALTFEGLYSEYSPNPDLFTTQEVVYTQEEVAALSSQFQEQLKQL